MKKLLILLPFILFWVPNTTHAAISFVTSTSTRNGGSVSSWTVPYASGATTDLIIVSALTTNNGANISGVTFNGNTMTAIAGASGAANTWSIQTFYIYGNSGTHDLVFSLSPASDIWFVATSYSGTLQSSSVIQASNYCNITTLATSGNCSITTTATSNAWAVATGFTEGETITGYTIGTIREATNGYYKGADSNGTVTPSSTYTATWSAGNATRWFVPVIEIAPVAAPTITTNRLAKFMASTSTDLGNSLFSDDGVNMTLTAGNLFLQIGALIDTITGGALNFGTTNATSLTIGRVGVTTTFPGSLTVNGFITFGNNITVPSGFGLDTSNAGVLNIGTTTATAITIGKANATTTFPGIIAWGKAVTTANCNSTTSPAVCGSAPSGSVAMATGGSTLVVNTTAVTANSQILITEDSSLGSRLGITCNTGTVRNYSVNARTPGTSFTIKSSANPTTNKACLSYWVVN